MFELVGFDSIKIQQVVKDKSIRMLIELSDVEDAAC